MQKRSMPAASHRTARRLGWACLLLAAVCAPRGAGAAESPQAQVVVIVDTSGSMKEAGMDPQRRSLLVTRLLADLVPGDLAAVRLLDLVDDQHLLPSEPTGRQVPCREDPSRMCEETKPATDWAATSRERQLGLLARPRRGDPDFKEQLADHLAQRSNNSPFFLAFQAARGFFDARSAGDTPPRYVIWLSDGRTDQPAQTERVISELRQEGVRVEAFVFGRGDSRLAEGAGIPLYRIRDAGGLMHAFSDAFRRMVGAPYRVDHRVAEQPDFEMQPAMEEVWVVVYGDDSLTGARLESPDGSVQVADYAADSWSGAGAYRVAHLTNPEAGRWTVRAEGGGAEAAYAVIQRSTLAPALSEPEIAVSGIPVTLVAHVLGGLQGRPLQDAELLRDAELSVRTAGREVTLHDDGLGADADAGDGRFSAEITFEETGTVPVILHLSHPLVERSVEETIEVKGHFRYSGGAVDVDLGSLRAGEESCRSLRFDAEHQGDLPFELRARRPLPAGHRLEVRTPDQRLTTSGSVSMASGTPLEICLVTTRSAPSSHGGGAPWVALAVAGTSAGAGDRSVPVALRWRVRELSFWERWGRLILLILLALLILVVILGFVLPHRFSSSLAVAFVPEREDLDDYPAQPVRSWRGVGIGFYRNARAYLHPDFRLSGRQRGALAALLAEKLGARVAAVRGTPLHRQTVDGDWEPVSPEGRRARGGDVYRIRDQGPYFRISTRPGGR